MYALLFTYQLFMKRMMLCKVPFCCMRISLEPVIFRERVYQVQKKARYLAVRAEIQTLEGVGGDNAYSIAMQQFVTR